MNQTLLLFLGPDVVRADEGQNVTVTVHRDGSGADTTTIRYRTSENLVTAFLDQNRATSDVDFISHADEIITFKPGALDYDIIIQLSDDDIPEDDESFYVEVN